MQLGSTKGHNPGPIPLGEHRNHLRLQQLPSGFSCSRHASHIPAVSAMPLPLLSLMEQVSPNNLILLPPPAWVEQTPKGDLQAEAESKPELSTRGCVAWEEEGYALLQLQVQHVVVQSLSCVQLFATPWTAARQASLSFTISWSLLKLMFIELVMPSNHLCCSLLLLPSIFPSVRFFSKSQLFASDS